MLPATFSAADELVSFADTELLAQWSMSMIALAEVYSIIGNIREIITGEQTEEIDALTWVLKSIKTLFEKMTNKFKTK